MGVYGNDGPLGAGDEPVETDGPFVGGKEVVSGYTEVDVADLEEAIRMVRTRPGCPVVEIRPLES
ncbi:MAG TPA: YciI family protein [Chloroflexota bacterium]|nr:YciI family protein [Chloroflexota bacterium]